MIPANREGVPAHFPYALRAAEKLRGNARNRNIKKIGLERTFRQRGILLKTISTAWLAAFPAASIYFFLNAFAIFVLLT